MVTAVRDASETDSRRARGRFGPPFVILLSVLALEASILTAPLLATWDRVAADLWMRVRYHLRGAGGGYACQEVTLIAIDERTQGRVGRWNGPQWTSREPYLDLIMFLQEYFRPTVLGFDIVFNEAVGEAATNRVSESQARMESLIADLERITVPGTEALAHETLNVVSRLLCEQSAIHFAHRLASVVESGAFPALLLYYFPGNFMAPSEGTIAEWSDDDVFGNSPDGREDRGARIPYLRDMAIPEADIHLPADAAEVYDYAVNAVLPEADLLDYTLLGYADVPPDADSVIRRVPLVRGFTYRNSVTRRRARVFVPSFALAASLLHLGIRFPLEPGTVEVFFGREIVIHAPARGELRAPIDAHGRLYLDYAARVSDFRAVSLCDVAPSRGATTVEQRRQLAALHKRAGTLDGRAAVVGAVMAGVDVGVCPIDFRTPLVLVHLTAMRNILEQRFLAPLGRRGTAGLYALVFLGFTAVCRTRRAVRLGALVPACALFYALAAYAAVHLRLAVLPLAGPVLYMVLCGFMVLTYRYVTEERGRRRVRGMFSTMVSDKVLSYLEENPDSFSLRGRNVEATVFFSDIADFTGISERLPPERLIGLLNTYLTPTTDCIMARGGYVDKYVGDKIMAVWGAPYPSADHAIEACRAALEQQRIIRQINRRIAAEHGRELRVRMGLNSGTVTAGNMGSERKFQYTVIGDTVNLAARLEPANDDFGTEIIIGDATRRMAGDLLVTRPLGRIVVVGKRRAAMIYELVGEAGGVPEARLAALARYTEALQCFFERRWDACLRLVEEILAAEQDGPSLHLKQRAAYCRANPPPENWQGEYVRGAKE
ncbi:MAG: adenylate/guanylate cyclase domain-containing protein [Lentisphaerae bacterium]|nr:adenylate/guanylate cyclase domain-containing protein [Lentisphaerota bacterium]